MKNSQNHLILCISVLSKNYFGEIIFLMVLDCLLLTTVVSLELK